MAVELSEGIQMISRLDVDAQENPLANTVAYGVDRVHRHITMTGHLYGARGLFAHRPTWDDFDPDLAGWCPMRHAPLSKCNDEPPRIWNRTFGGDWRMTETNSWI